MTLDEALLRDIIDFSDDEGVLSFYASHLPDQATEQQPAGPIELRNQLRSMIDTLSGRDSQRAKAVQRRIEASEDDIGWLTNPKATGRGRALFLGVASGTARSLSLQLPFRERAVYDESAYVRPLLAAYDEGRAAGVIDVSMDWIRMLRWEAGEIEEVFRREFEVLDEQVAHQKRGPAPSNGHMFGRGNSNRDKFAGHLNDLDQRFLFEVLNEVAATAQDQSWDRIVVAGSPKLRNVAADFLRGQNGGRSVLVTDRALAEESAPLIAGQIWPLLRSVREGRERALVTLATERALAGGTGALGLRAVCNALNENRVQHLIYDDALQLTGFRSEAGTLHPRMEGLVAASELTMRREPLFVERMVESALAADASITPLSPEATALLGDHEGVAALLRW